MIAFTQDVKINTKIDVQDILKNLQALSGNRVLVGVPEGEDPRSSDPKAKVGNAALARIHDLGSPKQGIPARPFMKPGIAKAQNYINVALKEAASYWLAKDKEQFNMALVRAGFAAQTSIQNVINKGEGFVPLKRATLLGRLRKRKYLWNYYHKPWMKDKKNEFLATLHPLIDSGSLRNAITFVVEGA
jgi:hypothetical protein